MRLYAFSSFLIALGAGFFLLSFIRRRRLLDRRSKFFRAFIRNVFFFNLLIIAGNLINLLDLYLGSGLSLSLRSVLQTGILVFMTGLKFLWLYSFAAMNSALVDRKLSPLFSRMFLYSSAFLMGLLGFTFIREGGPFGDMPVRFLLIFIESLIIAASFAFLLRMFWWTHLERRFIWERGAFFFSAIYLLLFSVLLLTLTLGFFMDRSRTELFTLINSCVMLLYNFLPLIWIKKYGDWLGIHPKTIGEPPCFEKRFEQYSISGEERAVTELLCEGYSNLEITRMLPLHYRDVWKHTRNVFQKTGVRNRIRLIQMFHRTGSE
ncbi:MAG: helix-turn-helix transcriptional regulator [Candidatus Aminicenantes bacterium]|nr:helix-turn-helix transcriptional regulator [Candidatus Aminicenantes bacterium]